MASDVIAIPEESGIETHGIERVSPKARAHVRIFDNFTMWLSANLVISTVGLGALAIPIFGLGFWDSLAVIIIFNVLGVLPVAFFSTLGPKLGLRQMTISRFSFGWVGGIIMALFNVAACIGWSVVSSHDPGQYLWLQVCTSLRALRLDSYGSHICYYGGYSGSSFQHSGFIKYHRGCRNCSLAFLWRCCLWLCHRVEFVCC